MTCNWGHHEVVLRVSGEAASRVEAYYLMSIHEHLPPQARKELKAESGGSPPGIP
jgi:hypothetical protein